jgi:hypothetical protein
MTEDILPELVSILKTNHAAAIREVIDAIGYLCFYNLKSSYTHSVVEALMQCLYEHIQDDLIRWKLVRAFESFHNAAVIELLSDIQQNDAHAMIRIEAARSLNIIHSRHRQINR